MTKEFVNEELMKLTKEQIYDLVNYLRSIYKMDTEILSWIRDRNINSNNIKGSGSSSKMKELTMHLLMKYWKHAKKIISDFNEYGGGNEKDEDKAYELLDNISIILNEEELPKNIKAKLLDDIFQEYNMHNSGFEDALIDLSFQICSTKEEWRYLVGKLEENSTDWNEKIIREIYKNHLEDESEYLNSLKSNLKWGSDYFELASYYIKQKNINEAVKVCEEGIEKGEGRNKELFDFLTKYYLKNKKIEDFKRVIYKAVEQRCYEEEMLMLLFNYYKANNLYEQARNTLIESFKYSRDKHEKYNQIKSYLSLEDWKKNENSLLQDIKEKDIEIYLQICMDKDNKDEVVRYLKEPRPNIFFDLDKFASKLKEDYPKEVIEYYYRRAFLNIENGNRKTYKVAVEYLKKAKDIYINILNDRDRWNLKLLEIKSNYSNRRAFLEEAREL